MTGQVRREVGAHPDRAHAWTPSPVRNRKSLVQIQVRNIRTEHARLGQAHECIQIRAIDVNLSPGLVDERTDLLDRFLKHAMRGWIGDHQRSEVVLVLGDLRFEVCDIDIADLVRRDNNNVHARHNRTGGVGAMRTARDQTHGSLFIAVGAVVSADGHQAGKFTLRTGIRLHGYGVIAGDQREPVLEFVDDVHIGSNLLSRCERVNLGELRPGDRCHFRSCVEFHSARAKRDHRSVKGEVFIRE